jgi:hypothetical protein
MRDRLTSWVLQAQPDEQNRQEAPARGQTWVLEDNDNAGDGRVLGADLRIDLDLEGPARQQQQQPQNEEQGNQERHDDADGNANQDADDGHRRVRVTFSSLGRFISRVLATPWVANYMGSLLEFLSQHSLILRRILSLHEPYTTLGWMDNVTRGSGALQALSTVGIKAPWHQKPTLEPIWWDILDI